jgi:hypothetical protein
MFTYYSAHVIVKGELMKIAFVSCTKLKANYTCNAKEMYQKSTLFQKATKYVEQQEYDDWFVLSAKHGLLKQNQEIAPYDLTLNSMKTGERKAWSEMVRKQIDDLMINITQADFYAGQKYREHLIPVLIQKGIRCTVPLEGKAIGEQLSFYKTNTIK